MSGSTLSSRPLRHRYGDVALCTRPYHANMQACFGLSTLTSHFNYLSLHCLSRILHRKLPFSSFPIHARWHRIVLHGTNPTTCLLCHPRPEDVKKVKKMYLDRIAIPHVTLDETFSALSSFITKYEPEEYEQSMGKFSKINAASRKLFTEREVYEQGLV